MNILVSACLLGLCTKYDGGHNQNKCILALAARHTLIPVCPEQLGGLSTPRPPAERQKDGRVLTKEGADLTLPFQQGAQMALDIARLTRADMAILKARSPSCGVGIVYDGSFTHTQIAGNGLFAALCLKEGIPVYTEENWPQGMLDDL